MKKFLITVAIIALYSVSAMAQSILLNNPDNEGYFGIRVGGEVTCPSNVKSHDVSVDMFKNGGGIEFGGIYNAPVVANFYVEPGLMLYYNTYSMKDDYTLGVDASVRKFGMRIPVMAGYHFDFTPDTKVSIFTGPELEIGFSAKLHASYRGESDSENAYGSDGSLNRVDLLWGIGAGVTIQKFYVGVKGGIGMLNMLKDGDGASFRENRVTFSLGYNF